MARPPKPPAAPYESFRRVGVSSQTRYWSKSIVNAVIPNMVARPYSSNERESCSGRRNLVSGALILSLLAPTRAQLSLAHLPGLSGGRNDQQKRQTQLPQREEQEYYVEIAAGHGGDDGGQSTEQCYHTIEKVALPVFEGSPYCATPER